MDNVLRRSRGLIKGKDFDNFSNRVSSGRMDCWTSEYTCSSLHSECDKRSAGKSSSAICPSIIHLRILFYIRTTVEWWSIEVLLVNWN